MLEMRHRPKSWAELRDCTGRTHFFSKFLQVISPDSHLVTLGGVPTFTSIQISRGRRLINETILLQSEGCSARVLRRALGTSGNAGLSVTTWHVPCGPRQLHCRGILKKQNMKKILLTMAVAAGLATGAQAQLRLHPQLISGIVDGTQSGGIPKGLQIYATSDILDLSLFYISRDTNGAGPWDTFAQLPAQSLWIQATLFTSRETALPRQS